MPPNVCQPGASAAAMPLLRSFFISRDHIPPPLLAIDYLTYGGEKEEGDSSTGDSRVGGERGVMCNKSSWPLRAVPQK